MGICSALTGRGRSGEKGRASLIMHTLSWKLRGRPDVGIVWNEMKVHTLLNTTMFAWCGLGPSFTMLMEIFHKRFPTLFLALFVLLFCPHVYLYSIKLLARLKISDVKSFCIFTIPEHYTCIFPLDFHRSNINHSALPTIVQPILVW